MKNPTMEKGWGDLGKIRKKRILLKKSVLIFILIIIYIFVQNSVANRPK